MPRTCVTLTITLDNFSRKVNYDEFVLWSLKRRIGYRLEIKVKRKRKASLKWHQGDNGARFHTTTTWIGIHWGLDDTFWIYVPIAQKVPLIHPQTLDGSIALRIFHGRCLNWEKFLCSCFETHCRLSWKPMIIRGWAMAQSNRSGSEFFRHSSLYLSINWSIDRAILNLSEKLHMFIVLGITAIGWFSSFQSLSARRGFQGMWLLHYRVYF